jgi:hypothetical protein
MRCMTNANVSSCGEYDGNMKDDEAEGIFPSQDLLVQCHNWTKPHLFCCRKKSEELKGVFKSYSL